ncbi:HK97-gp10 family putative phage morphogenesis protein [Stakelama pacifica]|uniref:HK97 gp10 family phage protein n=1 Tax=Stakelama pacifica TaxID=517720 RepID=A0A4R6FK36_9SPHN|nr:HK97-gp10 family putative phage morphogenesis protein [Stakelama pacifica]TDN81783.1 HK97 gp10 family phage protein [Stakelama pacifica]GGO96556.1 hypothetical protein GCM10011329_23360 [Stakelama pacifica]
MAKRPKGLDAHLKRLARLYGPEGTRLVDQAIFVGADEIRVEAQISITTGSVSGAGHVPSLPGQPPNNDTGTLANFINVEHRAGSLKATVRSDATYSADLEFGTSKMAERPFMRPARDKKKSEVKRLVQQAMNKAVKGSGT